MYGRARVIVAIPAYNEEAAVGNVVNAARPHADEILVVDDGSSDATAAIAHRAGAVVVRHLENRGKGAAVRTALRYVVEQGFDAVVFLDADGQHDPREIPLLLEPVLGRNSSSVDIALGARYGRMTDMPVWRRVGKRVLDVATALASRSRPVDSQCGFRAFNRRAARTLHEQLTTDGFAVESETIIVARRAALSYESVDIHCRYRGVEEPHTMGSFRHAWSVLRQIVAVSTRRSPNLLLKARDGGQLVAAEARDR